MPTACREQIMAAVMTLLTNALTGVQVERNRGVEVDTYPAVIVRDGGHTIETQNHGFDDVAMQVCCELYVEGATDAAIGPAFNDLHARVITALMADRTLGGLVLLMDELAMDDPVDDRAEGHGPLLASTTDIQVVYQRVTGDPYTFAPS